MFRTINLYPQSLTVPQSLVIFLHGYGANGADLLPISHAWAPDLPRTLFAAPDAPHRLAGGFGGYMWFPIQEISPEAMARNLDRALPSIRTAISALQKQYQVSPSRTALVGFSQGAMVALSLGLAEASLAHTILAYSGMLVCAPSDINPAAKVCLYHGKSDGVVPVAGSEEAHRILQGRGLDVRLHVEETLDHGISSKGVECGRKFLADSL